MPRLVDIYEKSEGASVFKNPSSFSPQGVGNSTPRSYGLGQYKNLTDKFGDGDSAYQDRGGFEDNSGFGLGFRQPYIWTSPGDSNFQKNIKKYDTRALPIGSAVQDAIRLGKFTLSGKGVLWLAKQQLLHMHQPHDEANMVDPTSHLVSAIRPASLGILPRVTKHISGGSAIGGILSLFGTTLGEPKSTVSPETLPQAVDKKQASYGLIRGNTATRARSKINIGKPSNNSFLGSFITGIFGKSFSAKQPNDVEPAEGGLVYRADQDLYTRYVQQSEDANSIFNRSITFPKNYVSSIHKYYNSGMGYPGKIKFVYSIYSSESPTKPDVVSLDSETITIPVGGTRIFDDKSYKKFLDVLEQDNKSFILRFRRKWQESSVLTTTKGNLGIKPTENYNSLSRSWINSRFAGIQGRDLYSADSVVEPARSLNNDSTGIPTQADDTNKTSYEQKLIVSSTEDNSRMKRFFESMVDGKLLNTVQQQKGSKNKLILNRYPVHSKDSKFMENLNEYLSNKFDSSDITRPVFYDLKQLTSTTDKSSIYVKTSKITGEEITDYTRYNMGMYSNRKNNIPGKSDDRRDSLNMLAVIDDTELQKLEALGEKNPTRDIIKFSFHDIVNNKIAFFRATLKSISDQVTPEWQDIRYLGRADKVYVYNGLTRTISFNFRVYASSKKEMWPMWQRINYLFGMTYPSKIITFDNQNQFGVNVAPYVKMTIGNLYKSQPILINSIGLTIPDEASWEIDSDMQLPMMVELSLTTTFLEQEAPRINNSHFDTPENLNLKVNIKDKITNNSEALAINNRSNQPTQSERLQAAGNSSETGVA